MESYYGAMLRSNRQNTVHVFNQLYTQEAMLEGIILKLNMALTGLTCMNQDSDDAISDATVKCLLRTGYRAKFNFAARGGKYTLAMQIQN